ncbi:hypothetical protein [Providencia rettgeri]|uniref:hypothetical protein n=1 Tax=Providencia rettgeri TaxID=587 RepID=UPI000807F738|nr:hypothetical protein [Providencia rettgeri]MDL9987976.1 hypothetical protein [Providencia rettgeri]OBY36446.1 hypothetical protein PR729_14310 [Providencia rettgeri]OBY37784.1 hypothetical protein PR729_03060 [Providencia rettgeri]
MNIPEPTFTPVLDNSSNDAVLMDSCINWNRQDERKVCNDRYASRLRKLQMYVLTEKPDYAAISQLIESEIGHIENTKGAM